MIYRQDDLQRARYIVCIPRRLFHSRNGSVAHVADSESLHVTVAAVGKINTVLAFASLYHMEIEVLLHKQLTVSHVEAAICEKSSGCIVR